MLTLDLAGEIVRVEGDRPFVVGRDGDLSIADNPYLHRRFLEFSRQDAIWWVTNVGSQISATVNDATSSVHAWLAPGGSLPLVAGESAITFTAGPTSYEILVSVEGGPDPLDPGEAGAVDDGTATLGRIRLTEDQRLMLVVLAEAALRRGMLGMSEIPSASAAAQRVGWTQKKFEKKLDNVCDRLAALGVRGLKGDLGNQAVSRRNRLVEYALSTRLVTADDLTLLDAAVAERKAGT